MPDVDLGAARAAATIKQDPLTLAIRQLAAFDHATEQLDLQALGAAPPEWHVLSANALAQIAQAKALEELVQIGYELLAAVKR